MGLSTLKHSVFLKQKVRSYEQYVPVFASPFLVWSWHTYLAGSTQFQGFLVVAAIAVGSQSKQVIRMHSDYCEQSAGSNVSIHWNNLTTFVKQLHAAGKPVRAVDHEVKLGVTLIMYGTGHSEVEGQLLQGIHREPHGWIASLRSAVTKSREGETEESIFCRRLLWEVKYCGRKDPNPAFSIDSTFQESLVDIGYRYQVNKQTQILFVILLPVVFTLEWAPHRYCSNDHQRSS